MTELEKIVQEYEESAGPEYEYTGPTVQSEVDAEEVQASAGR